MWLCICEKLPQLEPFKVFLEPSLQRNCLTCLCLDGTKIFGLGKTAFVLQAVVKVGRTVGIRIDHKTVGRGLSEDTLVNKFISGMVSFADSNRIDDLCVIIE